MTSIIDVPRCEMAALRTDSSCCLSPENERATNDGAQFDRRAHVSIGGRSLTTPFLALVPRIRRRREQPLVRP